VDQDVMMSVLMSWI